MIKLCSIDDIPTVATQDNVVVINLVTGAFAPTEYEKDLLMWSTGATKYTKKDVRVRIAKRWKVVAKKLNFADKINGKQMYIATQDGTETIYVKFFRKFLEFLQNE